MPKALKPGSISNHLVCFLSENATDKNQMPAEYCTHLVYEDMVLSRTTKNFVASKSAAGFQEFLSLRERFVTTKFAVSLNPQLVRELADSAERDQRGLSSVANQLAKWISHNELNGVALARQVLTTTRHKAIMKVLESLQEALGHLGEPKPALIFSGYALPDKYSEKTILGRVKDYNRIVDIFVMETHYHEEEQFCRLVYPSVFVRVEDVPTSIPVKSALFWMEMVKEDTSLNSTHNMCFSLDLATLSFDVGANSRPSVGGWCTGRKWINYGSMCGTSPYVMPEEDQVALSTSRRRAQAWLSYDSEVAIKEKVSRAMDVFHGVCVAVFHVDHDDNDAICDGINRFPRLQAIREVQKSHVEKEFYEGDTTPPPRPEDRGRSGGTPPHGPALFCVLGDLNSELDHYPTEYCTHLIYRDMVFFYEHKWFMPRESEQSFNAFKQLRATTDLPLLVGISTEQLADFYVPLWRNPAKMGAFARSAIEWLHAHGFDGIALLDQQVKTTEVVKRYSHIVKRLRDEFHAAKSKLLVVVGLSILDSDKTPEDVAEHLEEIARTVDYLILETHRSKHNQGPCRLSLPSSFLEDTSFTDSVPVRTALAWMRILHVPNETMAHMCVSFNMAVLNFKTKKVGEDDLTCKTERWSNYRDVCSDKEGFSSTVRVEGALGIFRSNKNAYQMYDEEGTIREKVERAVTLFPRACVAAYYVEYDDSMGLCHPKFSRLAEMSQALIKGPVNNLVELRPPPPPANKESREGSGGESRARSGGEVPPPPGQPAQEERPALAHNLICVMSEKTSVKEQFPESTCDFIVYTDLTYNGQEDLLVPKTNGSGFELFTQMAEQGSGNHLVAVSQDDIRECIGKWKDPLQLSHFVITTTAWLTKHKVDGLAFLDLQVVSDTMPTLLKMLEKFHESFKENRPRSLILMYGVQVRDFRTNSAELLQDVLKIAKIVDYTILETHHMGHTSTCSALVPTSFREYSDKADTLPVVTAVEWIKQLQSDGVPPPNVCFSISMAALHYTLTSESTNVGAPCDNETLLSYSKTCTREDWVGPIVDDRAIAAYHFRSRQWQSYLTPDSITKMMRLALKVNPSVCVAAYYVDYEDYEGICQKNHTFPRLNSIRHVLDQVRLR